MCLLVVELGLRELLLFVVFDVVLQVLDVVLQVFDCWFENLLFPI